MTHCPHCGASLLPSSSSLSPLTPRQVEVVVLLARGYSSEQIADILFIEFGTVKNHLHNIYQRLGVRRLADAVRVARELAII